MTYDPQPTQKDLEQLIQLVMTKDAHVVKDFIKHSYAEQYKKYIINS